MKNKKKSILKSKCIWTTTTKNTVRACVWFLFNLSWTMCEWSWSTSSQEEYGQSRTSSINNGFTPHTSASTTRYTISGCNISEATATSCTENITHVNWMLEEIIYTTMTACRPGASGLIDTPVWIKLNNIKDNRFLCGCIVYQITKKISLRWHDRRD